MRQTSYGVLASDRTHVATATYSIVLPTLESKGAVLRKIAGGWQLAGVSTYISGAPLQLSSGASNFSMTGTFADGSPISATRVTGSPDLAAMPLLECDPTQDVPEGFLFNNACFAAPTPYDPATGKEGVNGAFVMPDMRGQAYLSHDLSAFKTFPVGSKGHRLQLRVSAYNVLNHPIRYPDLSENLTLRFDRGVLANPQEFGALPQDNKFGRRIVQIALRYMF